MSEPKVAELFWAKIDIKGPDDCWHWMAGKNGAGYGIFNTGYRYLGTDRAHRVAYILANGSIAAGMVICHKCDERSCCNPKHLIQGTQQFNIDDKVAKGRQAKLESHGRSKLTKDDVVRIRESKNTCTDLAKQFKVSITRISRIKKGESWKNL